MKRYLESAEKVLGTVWKSDRKALNKTKKKNVGKEQIKFFETSLLRTLQAQTLPDATPPLGKIPLFTKIAVTFEPMKRLRCPSRFRISQKIEA